MSDYHQKRAREIVDTIKYATLATVTEDGKPWNSPVAHVIDDELNIYWFSDKEGQHSKNIRANGQVFIVIYDSTVPEGDGEGVYIEATVEELEDLSEINKARSIKKRTDILDGDKFLGDAVRRVYKATPHRVWMNDAEIENEKFIRDFRVEVSVEGLKK